MLRQPVVTRFVAVVLAISVDDYAMRRVVIRRATLVFDRECGAVSDPYREERRALDVYRAARSTNSTSTASGSIANTNRPNAR